MSNERTCQCGQAHGACTTEFQYAVKIVCGEQLVATAGAPPPVVAPGQYWTAINIHNPTKCQEANIRWKVAVALPNQVGPVSAYQNLRPLQPDMAIEIDCPQILPVISQPAPKFAKGYVVIESDIELDVVAVYSGAQGANGLLNSFHTERVQPRCVPVCEDLVLPLHTGFADWRTVSSPTPAPLGPVVPVTPVPPTWQNPFGAKWVSQTITDGTTSAIAAPPTNPRSYELCFNLCFGYEVPSPFQIQVLVDDSAIVRLNGSPVGGVVPFNTPTSLTVNPNLLSAGRNCFKVEVSNVATGPTGFALAGILRVIRGKCPCST